MNDHIQKRPDGTLVRVPGHPFAAGTLRQQNAAATARPRGARPRPTPRPRGSQPPGAAYQCWVDAGGGTKEYDADRYMALLKDGGILAPRRGLVEILAVAIARTAADGSVAAEPLATALVDELGKDGYRIHDVALCVRPGDPAGVGRPMTPEEERQVGLWEGR